MNIRQLEVINNLDYIPLEKLIIPSPVNKLKYLMIEGKDKIILDLGALDETAYDLKLSTDYWVHKKLAFVAKQVIGVDSSDLIPEGGIKTSENSMIFKGNVYHLENYLTRNNIDLIIAGELIEHLPNVLLFFENIKKISNKYGLEMIITTPNASSLYNFILGIFKRESTHKDHLSIFSYKILNTLCKKTRFRSWQIIPYYVKFSEMVLGSKGIKKLLIILFEKMINFLEYLFPMLSGGLIVKIKI